MNLGIPIFRPHCLTVLTCWFCPDNSGLVGGWDWDVGYLILHCLNNVFNGYVVNDGVGTCIGLSKPRGRTTLLESLLKQWKKCVTTDNWNIYAWKCRVMVSNNRLPRGLAGINLQNRQGSRKSSKPDIPSPWQQIPSWLIPQNWTESTLKPGFMAGIEY